MKWILNILNDDVVGCTNVNKCYEYLDPGSNKNQEIKYKMYNLHYKYFSVL